MSKHKFSGDIHGFWGWEKTLDYTYRKIPICLNQNNKLLSVGLIIRLSYRGVRSIPERCPKYDIKLHLMVRLRFWGSGECALLLHCHYSQFYTDLESFYLLGCNLWVKLICLKVLIFDRTVCKKKKKKRTHWKQLHMNVWWTQFPNLKT